MSKIDEPVQGSSFYVERIDLTSKLRLSDQKCQGSRSFSGKQFPQKFPDTDPSNLIISRFTHFEQPFSQQKQKITYSTTLTTFSIVFQISPYLCVNYP